MYHLHPTLAADTLYLGQLKLSDVLLMNNSSYLWLVLVPRRSHIREIYELNATDQAQLQRETSFVSEKIAHFSQAEKMNIAAFGNMVPQLHIHIMARHSTDPAWPHPIWLNPAPQVYESQTQQNLIQDLQQLLTLSH